MNATTATSTRLTVGNASTVHHGDAEALYTFCGAERGKVAGVLPVTVTTAPVDCKACTGDTRAPAAEALPTEAPAACTAHPAGRVTATRTVKRGTYAAYTCGCKVWTA